MIFSQDAAGELLANGLDHLPLPRHHLQGLGDGLAELGEPAAAARAGGRAGDHHALARQMRRKGRAHRLLAGERGAPPCPRLARRRQLHPRPRSPPASSSCNSSWSSSLRPRSEDWPYLLAPQLGDQQLVMGHHRLGAGGARLGLLPCRALGGQCRRQRVYRCGCRHEPDYRTVSRP